MLTIERTTLLHRHSVTSVRATERLVYIDNLRTTAITMVIVHHAAQAYGPTSGSWPISNTTQAAILGPFFIVNVSFGLALLFLLAGYFVPPAYDRRGTRGFLINRFMRLAVPLMMIVLVLLIINWLMYGHKQPVGDFLANELRHLNLGHMWFVAHLMVYSCLYSVWRWFASGFTTSVQQPRGVPNHRGIVAFTLLLALVTFLVRISYPIDQWVDPLPFISFEPAHLPYYISLFALGSVAYRRNWLELLPTRTGMTWLRIGLVAAILPYSELLLHKYASLDIGLVSAGGFSIEALVWSVIESFLCVGLCIGLLTLFREHFNHQGRLARHLTAASYAVYVIHVFPVLAIQQALASLPLAPLAKFAIVILTAVPLSFLLGAALRKLPGARRVL